MKTSGYCEKCEKYEYNHERKSCENKTPCPICEKLWKSHVKKQENKRSDTKKNHMWIINMWK